MAQEQLGNEPVRLLTPHLWTLAKLQEDRSLVCFTTSLDEELLQLLLLLLQL